MPVENARVRASPVGNFFARLGRRVRSKSPAVTRLTSTETPKRASSRGPQVDNVNGTNHDDSGDVTQTPHRFGTLLTRLSRRKSKRGEKDILISPDSGEVAVSPPKFGTPRPAMSENDLRHVTLQRGTDLQITPLAGVSQFMSEDNLAFAECGTPAYRVPSYVRISCALSGYRKSPRYLEGSATRTMGRSIVERRLGLFEHSTPDRDEELHQNNSEPRANRSVLAMGTSLSTPSPVKALIGQFDRLQLCSKEKKNVDDETPEPSKAPVVTQPTSSVMEPMNVSTATPASMEVSTTSETTHEPSKDVEPSNDVPKENHVNLASTAKKSGDMRTGEDFVVLLESVRSRLEASIKQALSELEEVESMPEEAGSSIRLAAGKAQLLVRKKLSKFDELVKKHLNPVEGDLQPATIDDLEGYWALVEIELNDIDECFQKVDEWRANGWQLKESAESQNPPTANSNINSNINNNNVVKKRIVPSRLATTPVDPEVRAKQVEKQKAAAEQRRKALAEAKQKARAAQQQVQTASTENDVSAQPCSDVLMVL
uniref:Disks large-associated protein 1 n=1 Tax=Haemonchus contortus TaxID=6289 RepID=A0A7I4Y9R4_HAECO